MINFKVNVKSQTIIGTESIQEKVLKIPSSLDDFSTELLKELTKHINISNDYSLVALCHKEKLSAILLAARQKKDTLNTSVLPIFIRSGKTDNEFIKNIELKDVIITAPSELAMGHHVNIPNVLPNPESIAKECEGDVTAYTRSLDYKGHDCWFLQFKLIPNCNIHGSYKTTPNIHDLRHLIND